MSKISRVMLSLSILSVLAFKSPVLAENNPGKFQLVTTTTGEKLHWTFLLDTETGEMWSLALNSGADGKGISPLFIPTEVKGKPRASTKATHRWNPSTEKVDVIK